MPVITRASSRLLTMFNQTSPSDTQPAQQAQPASVATPPSPLDRLLGHFETLLSHIQNSSPTTPTTSSISQPGRDLDSDGRKGSGGRIGFKQGSRASPIAGASVSGQPETGVSHSPTRLPMPDTARPTRSFSLSDLGQSTPAPTPTPSSSSIPVLRELDADGGGDNEGRPLEFKQGSRAPPGTNPEVSHSPPRLSSGPTLSSNTVRSSSILPPGQNLQSSPTSIHSNLHHIHDPHGRATVPMSNITSKDGGRNNLFTPRDGPCDLDINPQVNRWQNLSTANADSTDMMSNIPSTSFPPLTAISKHKWPTFNGATENFLEWKAQFLAVLCSTELAPLYDASVDNLIMPSTRADHRSFTSIQFVHGLC